MRKVRIAVGLLAALLVTPLASAVPIDFDGDIDVADLYEVQLDDTPGEDPATFGGPSWDIETAWFSQDSTWLYLGIETAGPFDRNGTDTSTPPVTKLLFQLSDGSETFFFVLQTDDAGETLTLDGVALAGADWDAATGTDLEVRIARSVLADLDSPFDFIARLDNSAMPADDIVQGVVPEPATLGLLAAGGVLAALRRRTA